MRPSLIVLSLLLALAVLTGGLLAVSDSSGGEASMRMRALVERYGLTDLALFCEARYTRHPSQADLHSAFQDHPGAFEHFPSGTLLPPPAARR